MPKDEKVVGSASQIFELFVQNSGATNGSGLTGLVFNTASLTAYYKRNTENAAVAITLANITTIGTFANNGFREVDATNMPGLYEFDPPNAAFNAGAQSVVFMLKGATNMAPVVFEVALKAINTQDAVRSGMTALPNAAAEAAGGLYTRGTGAGQINQPNNGMVDTNVVRLANTAQTGRDIGASVLLSAGSAAGQLDFTNGVVKSNVSQILATALTEGGAGQIAAAFKKLFDVVTPTAQADNIALLDGATPFGKSASSIVPGTVDDSAFTPTTTAFESNDVTDATAETWKSVMGIFTAATTTTALRRVRFLITAYSKVGSNGRFTVTMMGGGALPSAPVDGDTFILV